MDNADQPSMRRRNAHCLQTDLDNEPTKEYTFNLHELTASRHSHPFQVTVSVDGQDLAMEIDTGASLSLVSEEIQESLLLNKRLQPSTVNKV